MPPGEAQAKNRASYWWIKKLFRTYFKTTVLVPFTPNGVDFEREKQMD